MGRQRHRRRERATPGITLKASSKTPAGGHSNPLLNKHDVTSEPAPVQDLTSQLASPDPSVREHAVVGASLLLATRSAVSTSFVQQGAVLPALSRNCFFVGTSSGLTESQCAQIRACASDGVGACLDWLTDDEFSAWIKDPTCIVNAALQGLLEGVTCFRTALETKQHVELAQAGLAKAFELLRRLTAFSEVHPQLVPLFDASNSSPVQPMTVAFASGFGTSFLCCPNLPRTASLYASFSAAAAFLGTITRAVEDMLSEEKSAMATAVRAKLGQGFAPVGTSLARIVAEGPPPIDPSLDTESTTDLDGESVRASWILNCAELYVLVAGIGDVPLSTPIPNWEITSQECVQLVIGCLACPSFANAITLLERLPTTQAPSPDETSQPATVEDNTVELEGGERLSDIAEVAAARQSEQEIAVSAGQLRLTEQAVCLIEAFADSTHALRGREQEDDDDDKPRNALLDALVTKLSQADDPITATFSNAVTALVKLPDVLSPVEFCQSLWDLYTALCITFQSVFDCIATIVSATNFPESCRLALTAADTGLGPLKAVDISATLVSQLLSQPSHPHDAAIESLGLADRIVRVTLSMVRRVKGDSESQLPLIVAPVEKLLSLIGTSSPVVPKPEEKQALDDDEDAMADHRRDTEKTVLQTSWKSLQLHCCELCSSSAMTWPGLMATLLPEYLGILEKKETTVVVAAALLDGLFDLFGGEDYDHVCREYSLVPRLETIYKRMRTLAKRAKLRDDDERFRVHAALKNLPAFIQYKRENMVDR